MKIGDRVRDTAPPRFESQADRIAHLLEIYKMPLTITLIASLVLFGSGKLAIPEVPPFWKVALTGVAAGSLPAAFVAKVAIIDPFIEKPTYNVASLDLEDMAVQVHEIPKALWNDRREGERSPWQPENGNIDFVVAEMEFLEDIGKLVVEGVNRELVDPAELIVRDQRIEEIHQDLLESTAEFERYKARERTRRLERDKELVSNLIAAVEHGLEFEAGTMEAIQNDELDRFKDAEPEKSETNRTDTSDPEMQTLNQMLGYEQEAMDNGASAGTDADGSTAVPDGGSP